MPNIPRNGRVEGDDGDSASTSSSYEPEYETEEVSVNQQLRLQVLTLVPPPIEFLASLRTRGREVSGRKVWTGSLFLAQYLCHQISVRRILDLDGQRILELGSGTGLLGMALCKVVSQPSCIVLSDGDDKAVDLLRQNLTHNGIDGDHRAVMAERLVWGDEGGGGGTDGSLVDRFSDRCRTFLDDSWRADEEVRFDSVVAGDVLYKKDLPGLFFQTVRRFLSNDDGTLWLCHVPRANVSQEIVVAAAQTAGFEVMERFRAHDYDDGDGIAAGFVGGGFPDEELERALIYRMKRASTDRAVARGGERIYR